MKASSTSFPIASARRSWMLNNLEPNFFASGFLNFLEKKREEATGNIYSPRHSWRDVVPIYRSSEIIRRPVEDESAQELNNQLPDS